jgi:hypothetical protein
MNIHKAPTRSGGRHAGGELPLYRRIVEGLEDKPAYLLLFGIAVLFVVSGLGTSIAGVVHREMWQSVIGFLGFIAALIAVVFVINRVELPHALQPAQNAVQVQLNQVRGNITQPKPGQLVGRTIECFGSATALPAGLHLWLATEVRGLLWPKGSEVYVGTDGQWSKTIFEDGATEEFSLSLFVANAEAHNAIAQWLQTSQQTGNYATLSGVIGTDRLYRVDGLRLPANAHVGPPPDV